MFYILCPHCGALVALPDPEVGLLPTGQWKTVFCEDCESVVEYQDDQVQFEAELRSSP